MPTSLICFHAHIGLVWIHSYAIYLFGMLSSTCPSEVTAPSVQCQNVNNLERQRMGSFQIHFLSPVILMGAHLVFCSFYRASKSKPVLRSFYSEVSSGSLTPRSVQRKRKQSCFSYYSWSVYSSSRKNLKKGKGVSSNKNTVVLILCVFGGCEVHAEKRAIT